jgi:hypothetical protein
MALDAVRLEQPMQPEAVEPGLLDRHDMHRPLVGALGSPLQSFEQPKQRCAVPSSNIVARDPVSTRCAHSDKPTGSAQFQSHKEDGMLIRSGGRGWAEKVGARHRSPPRVGVSNRLENPAAHPHRILLVLTVHFLREPPQRS